MFKFLSIFIIVFNLSFAKDFKFISGEVKVNNSLNTLKINEDNKLSEELLDYWWENREDLSSQKAIANYLLTFPRIEENYNIAWKLARLIYFIGNYGYGKDKILKSSIAVKFFDYGVKAGKVAIKLSDTKVDGYYWYAVNLGSYGLAKGIVATAIIAKDGINALNKVKEIDPSYHWYGYARVLGRYYQELPKFLGGNQNKALELYLEACNKSSEFGNNWLFLGRYYLSVKQYDKALNACKKSSMSIQVDGKYEELRYKEEAKNCIKIAKSQLK